MNLTPKPRRKPSRLSKNARWVVLALVALAVAFAVLGLTLAALGIF